MNFLYVGMVFVGIIISLFFAAPVHAVRAQRKREKTENLRPNQEFTNNSIVRFVLNHGEWRWRWRRQSHNTTPSSPFPPTYFHSVSEFFQCKSSNGATPFHKVMEVVSPLTFARTNPGGKRRFGSPLHGDSEFTSSATTVAAAEDFDMDECPAFGFPAAKRRRRFLNDGGVEIDSFSFQAKENCATSSFVQAQRHSHSHSAAGKLHFFFTVRSFIICFSRIFCLFLAALISNKRNRTSIQPDHVSAQRLLDLQHVVEQQAAEIQRLTSENDSAQRSTAELSSQHSKVEHENKILKRAVAIQQERQNQLSAELEGARQFKLEAEDRIHRLEQMNLTLQYQLQQSNSSPGNDFMGSPTWGF